VSVIQALILGIVQGLTEFMPISSSAHLVIMPWAFGWKDPGLAFDLALHLGTLVALIWFFSTDWVRLARAGIASIVELKINDADRRLAWLLVIGSIPGGIAGALGEGKIEELFHEPSAPHRQEAMIGMAVIIALLGAALFVVERVARHLRTLDRVSLKDAAVIGLAQGLAIVPGVSRSGSTITAGLALGLRREAAARFSFLLAAPIIAGAGLKSLADVYGDLRSGAMAQAELTVFAVGFAAAVVSGYLCIKFLLRFLQRNSTDIFVYYRWCLAAAVIILALVRG